MSSPLTYGILRPVILLPEHMERDDEATLTYILTHPSARPRAGLGWGPCRPLLVRRPVSPPPVFPAPGSRRPSDIRPLRWDLELSCDERVMDTLGGREKASYALTLIDMEEARSQCFSPP